MSKKLFKLRFMSELDGFSDGHHTDHETDQSDHDEQHYDDSSSNSGHFEPHYAAFVPKMARRIKNFGSDIECAGCHQHFPCYQDSRLTLPSEQYFRHCVEQCSQYRSLNLARNCDKCHQTFLNAVRLGMHEQRHHRNLKTPKTTTADKPKRARKKSQKGKISKVTKTPLQKYDAAEVANVKTEHDADADKYEPFVPKIVAKRIKSYNATIQCKGCSMEFPCSKYAKECHPSKSYYIHCIEQCAQYAELGLIRHCDKCRLSFIDPKNLGNHLLHHHRDERERLIRSKPSWMSFVTLKNIMTFASYKDKIACKGCNQLLPCIRRGRHSQYSLEFYVHCIEECEAYRKLGLIAQCERCSYVFINQQALRNHKCLLPDEDMEIEQKFSLAPRKSPAKKRPKLDTPSWMSEGIARNIRACGNYPDITCCKGCGKEFRFRKAGTTNHYSLEYYTHCIEECDEYKKLSLIQRCDKCQGLFLNKLAYAHHRC